MLPTHLFNNTFNLEIQHFEYGNVLLWVDCPIFKVKKLTVGNRTEGSAFRVSVWLIEKLLKINNGYEKKFASGFSLPKLFKEALGAA